MNTATRLILGNILFVLVVASAVGGLTLLGADPVICIIAGVFMAALMKVDDANRARLKA